MLHLLKIAIVLCIREQLQKRIFLAAVRLGDVVQLQRLINIERHLLELLIFFDELIRFLLGELVNLLARR